MMKHRYIVAKANEKTLRLTSQEHRVRWAKLI